jgi:hypothetical protein
VRQFVTRLLPILLLAVVAPTVSGAEQRTVILRERATVDLLQGTFPMELIKIRGYLIDVKLDGKKRRLKRGEAFSPSGGNCSVVFHKVSPETRIARFLTDCS